MRAVKYLNFVIICDLQDAYYITGKTREAIVMRALTNDVGLCVLADKGVRRVREASYQEVSRNWPRSSLDLYTTLCSFVSIDLIQWRCRSLCYQYVCCLNIQKVLPNHREGTRCCSPYRRWNDVYCCPGRVATPSCFTTILIHGVLDRFCWWCPSTQHMQ